MNEATVGTPPGAWPAHGHAVAARRSAELTIVFPTLNERTNIGLLIVSQPAGPRDRKTVPLLRLA